MTLPPGELGLLASTATPASRSTPRALVADPIEVTLTGTPRGTVTQTWRPCTRKHRAYIEAGLLPISCSRCEHESEADQ